MTPEVIRYGQKGNFVYELSTGDKCLGNEMFGVTVAELNGNAPSIGRSDLSTCLHSKEEAEEYINNEFQKS